MNNYKELEPRILDWAEERDLLKEDNSLQQMNKIVVSVGQLSVAVRMKDKKMKEFIQTGTKVLKTEDEIKNSLGKTLYEMIILAELHGVSLEECLTETYKNKNK